MIRFYFLMLLITAECWALEAVVTVLETPMLRHQQINSRVVQYLRRGDVIKIHPSAARSTRFDQMAPSRQKLDELLKEIDSDPARYDPMFSGKKTPMVNPEQDEFIPVLDRQGLTAYVLSSHLYVFYGTSRELDQSAIHPDPTDYRLEEPLPAGYPLLSPSGYRGQGVLGITQPYNESYRYKSNIRNKGYQSPLDFNYTILKRAPKDQQDRLYLGATLNYRYFANAYLLEGGRLSEETGHKLGLGPYLSYDAYKGERHRVNLYASLNINLFNQLTVAQSDRRQQLEDTRIYRTITFAPRLGSQYHLKKFLEETDLDLVLGTYLEMESPTSFHATNRARQPDWWQRAGSDSFRTQPVFSLAAYLGLQTAY